VNFEGSLLFPPEKLARPGVVLLLGSHFAPQVDKHFFTRLGDTRSLSVKDHGKSQAGVADVEGSVSQGACCLDQTLNKRTDKVYDVQHQEVWPVDHAQPRQQQQQYPFTCLTLAGCKFPSSCADRCFDWYT
jgi:hypothetical protein